ncbi:MAG: OadG family transporter subunit [Butyricimonas paravirosa]
MITLAINWGYALLVTGVGMVTVFLLLILLIWIINLQTKLTNKRRSCETVQDTEKAVVTTDTHPTPRTSCHRYGYASIFQLLTRNLT